MSTTIQNWEGNIGSPPEHRSFPNGNNPPRNLLRLNVFFDNSIPDGSGGFKDRGGFWCQVEWWHRDAERYAALFKKGMRITVQGRALMDTYENRDDETVSVLKVEANRLAILPHRVTDIALAAPASASNASNANVNAGNASQPASSEPAPPSQTSPQADYDDFNDDIPF